MIDEDRPGPTPPDDVRHANELVTLDVVSSAFEAQGLPRSLRTLQRYCGNGTLDCVKEATETGDTYFVHWRSVEPAITALKQLHQAKDAHRHATTPVDMTAPVAPANEPLTQDINDGLRPTVSDTDAAGEQGSTGPSQPDMSGYVAQLEKRLDEKDDEIGFLREELVDRRGQIRDMKAIIDGQNQLLETINANVAPIFRALATTVEKKQIDVRKLPVTVREDDDRFGSPSRDRRDENDLFQDAEQARRPGTERDEAA
jgi:hypothetical protein